MHRHRNVRKADSYLDEDEKYGWKVSLSKFNMKKFKSFCCRPTTLDKFSESFWRWTFYFSAHVVSVCTLLGKPWVWNTFECWYNYPDHNIGVTFDHYFVSLLYSIC